jgi:WD40 repeat protein
VLCLPDGNTLLTGGHGGLVHVWDLNTKRLLRSFGGNGTDCYVRSLYYVSGRIVAGYAEDEIVKVWTLDGSCLHTFNDLLIHAAAPSGHELLFAQYVPGQVGHQISSLSAFSGELTQRTTNWGHERGDLVWVERLAVASNFLIALRQFSSTDDNEESRNVCGLYLLDRSHLSVVHFQHGAFQTMAVTEDSGYLVAAMKADGLIDIFSLRNNRLVLQHTMGHPPNGPLDLWRATMLIHGRKLYATLDETHDGGVSGDVELKSIDVFDLFNGSREKVLYYHGHDPLADTTVFAWNMATNGRELFCAFNIDWNHRSRYTIRAYPL